MLWHSIIGFTKFGDKRVNDLDLLSGYVVEVACLHRENPCRRICMQLRSPYWGGPPLGVQILYTFPTPKMGIKQIEQFNDIYVIAESSGVTKLELFQPFPHCK